MSSRILPLVAAVALALTATPSQAQKAAKLSWGPAPPFLPAGAKFALVSGDPGSPARSRSSSRCRTATRSRRTCIPTDETVAVKSGHFHYGMGDKIDSKTMKVMNAGQSGTMPANGPITLARMGTRLSRQRQRPLRHHLRESVG